MKDRLLPPKKFEGEIDRGVLGERGPKDVDREDVSVLVEVWRREV